MELFIFISFSVLYVLFILIKHLINKKKNKSIVQNQQKIRPEIKSRVNPQSKRQFVPQQWSQVESQIKPKVIPKVNPQGEHKKSTKYNFILYHFTEPQNIPSIKRYGLLSWQELLTRNIFHIPASNELSRDLDRRNNLGDYVRLSTIPVHPMFSAAIYYGRVKQLIWLKIIPDVIDFPDTLFSDDNATRKGSSNQ